MGLDTIPLGQGNGRVADGLATCVEEQWAIIFDAKIRGDGYKMYTDDRAFKEYIERHKKELGKGIKNIHFTVISSSFKDSDLDHAREIALSPNVKSFALLEAEALVKMVELRLREPRRFDFHQLERCLSQQRIVTPKDVVLSR